ncbi:hypothetical protein TEA_010613 [Camellia sinensis var. sinensis]|uniref:Succinate dehydrogenase assembly factor 2, mitochondrial n=1 Tax=Camellia sinensis var. sinensis TaxID=542762 RepID=A0A4S4D9I7_CAMSN|nr:hypothetical protein TEA_010613 [Camellia sinensis var. sinensis]
MKSNQDAQECKIAGDGNIKGSIGGVSASTITKKIWNFVGSFCRFYSSTKSLNIDLSDEESKRRLFNRLLYRSRQRGFLELDLILGKWVEDHINSMDENGIKSLVDVLDLAPHDVGWSPCARHMGNILSNHLVQGGDLSEDEENPEEEINLSVNPSS